MGWQVVATGVNPWLREPILKSPERATCVSMLGKTSCVPLGALYSIYTKSPGSPPLSWCHWDPALNYCRGLRERFASPRVFPAVIREPVVDHQCDDSGEKQYCGDKVNYGNDKVPLTVVTPRPNKQLIATDIPHQREHNSAKTEPEHSLPRQKRFCDWFRLCVVSLR